MSILYLLLVSSVLLLSTVTVAGIPADPFFFSQRVDHFTTDSRTFLQRYYNDSSSFKGCGYPILLIIGGEGSLPPSSGFLYPYVLHTLAPQFSAMVLELEHRYYGESQPFTPFDEKNYEYLTPDQALADLADFINWVRAELNCSSSQQSPVITFGGSYPGVLSLGMRLRYPSIVDFAYAASAPIKFWAQQVNSSVYYSKISQVAEQTSPGCFNGVQQTLLSTINLSNLDKNTIISNLNLCTPLPQYLQEGDASLLAKEINMIVMDNFASLNMGAYGSNTDLSKACNTFMSSYEQNNPWNGLAQFLALYASGSSNNSCYDISSQIPAGPNATVSTSDFSGAGPGRDGEDWEYQTCTYIIATIGTSGGDNDMFLPRPFDFEWLQQHCLNRFGNIKQWKTYISDTWGFNRLEKVPLENVFFTNGEKDGWSVGGVDPSLASTEKNVYVVSLPNGAHHSDLSHAEPGPNDSEDIQAVHKQFIQVLDQFLGQSK